MILVPLLLVSCSKDPINQEEEDGYATIGSFERLEYSAVHTDGCDVSANVANAVNVPDLDRIKADMEESNIAFSVIGVFILEKVGKAVASALLSRAFASAKEYFFGPDEETKSMRALSEVADQMEEKMTELMKIAEKTLVIAEDDLYNTIRSAYVAFQSKLYNITSLNNLYTRQLKEDISEAELEKLINEWGTNLVNGNLAKDNLINLYHDLQEFYYMYDNRNRNLFAVYDMFVSCSTPWEALGYDIRETFRSTIAAEFARTIYLTSLYYKINYPKNEQAQKDFMAIADNLKEFLKMDGNEVVRRTDVVCQIQGARFIAKGFTSTYGQSNAISKNPFPANQLKESELNAIITFYKNQGVDDNFTIIDCLNEGGANIIKEHDPKIVLSNTEYKYVITSTFPLKANLSISHFAKNDSVISYKNAENKLVFEPEWYSDGAKLSYKMSEHFIVAPDGITR